MEARAMNRPFIKLLRPQKPSVRRGQDCQTLDGKIATRTGDSNDHRSGNACAGQQNATILTPFWVGINTILADDPCPLAPGKVIKKVIVDSRLRIPEAARVFDGAQAGQVILATTKKAPAAKAERLKKAGPRSFCARKKGGRVDLKWLFKELAKDGMSSILIEGGARTIGSALKAGLVDRLHVYIAPKIIGDDRARGSVAGLDSPNSPAPGSFLLTSRADW